MPRPARNVVGRILSRLRNEKGWSQEVFTAKCQLAGWDISRGIIVSIEGGVRRVEDWQVVLLANALNVHPGRLFPGSLDVEDLPLPREETQRIRREKMDRVRWNKLKEAESEANVSVKDENEDLELEIWRESLACRQRASKAQREGRVQIEECWERLRKLEQMRKDGLVPDNDDNHEAEAWREAKECENRVRSEVDRWLKAADENWNRLSELREKRNAPEGKTVISDKNAHKDTTAVD